MSRTNLDAATLARYLRATDDGRTKWVCVQAIVMLDVADMLDEVERLRSVVSDGADNARELRAENAKLREVAGRMLGSIRRFEVCSDSYRVSSVYEQWMRELGVEVD